MDYSEIINALNSYGDVIRLNQKTVTLACNEGQWRVSYGLLFKIVSPDVDFLPAQ